MNAPSVSSRAMCTIPTPPADRRVSEETALTALYTFPRVRELLAPSGSLGSIADEVDAVLSSQLAREALKEKP
jgi:hypothetical protein